MSHCDHCPIKGQPCRGERLPVLCRHVAKGDTRWLSRLAVEPGQTMPSLARQALTFGTALVKHVAAGMPSASTEEIERRRSICAACPHLTDAGRCEICGCRVALKTAWELERCPIDRW